MKDCSQWGPRVKKDALPNPAPLQLDIPRTYFSQTLKETDTLAGNFVGQGRSVTSVRPLSVFWT